MNVTQHGVIKQFRRLGVRFLVVGGQAMRAYGIDRPTRDLDLWVARDLANAQAMQRFLQRVQNRPPLERLQQPNFKFTVGDPSRPDVDILTSVAGDPPFDDLYAHRQLLNLDQQEVDVVAPSDLVAIKEAAAHKHEADVASGTLSPGDMKAATGTAAKERRDIVFLRMWIGTGQ